MKVHGIHLISPVLIIGRNLVSQILYLVMVLFILNSCQTGTPPLFVLKKDTGIEFKNQLNPTPELNILSYLYYYNGGGVAAGDFNNDGLVDLYFTGNQTPDKLFLNQGNFKFKDVSSPSGIQNIDGWTTGVSLVDINNDGLLDIYVCKVGEFKTISGRNLLYLNQGAGNNGIPVFKEAASTYNLDIKSFSTQAAFFDYDLDGDLDMFLLNHSVNPNNTYGKGVTRQQIDSLSGDKLFQNIEGQFMEVSAEAGIFQGRIGYGLGLGLSDLNKDGYPDIYIGNDFFENDYLYLNQRDGSFKEIISENINNVGHTSHYSMGNDIADLDNDGWPDIVSLDMLPKDLEAYKTSGREFNNQIYDQYLRNGYRPQYMQNTLLRNAGGQYFQEIAYVSGISSSDWSWGPLIADLDNDGNKDLFVSNGILGATNDMDFINFIADRTIQEQLKNGMKEEDLRFTEKLPTRKLSNVFFRNNGDLTFRDATSDWFKELPSYSNGSTYADLDNDGDLDLIVNNVNSEAFILENRSERTSNHFIKVRFRGSSKNRFGIGAKIKVVSDTLSLFYENFSTRGYLSATPPQMTIGIGQRDSVQSVEVTWPDGSTQKLEQVKSGSVLTFDHRNAETKGSRKGQTGSILQVTSSPFTNFKHSELTSYEFGREPLIPYTKGSEGPKISVADIDGDGRSDFYIGGGKKQAGALFLQTADSSFVLSSQSDFDHYSSCEETDNAFFDADGDGDLDLIVVSGGNEALGGKELTPVLYINENGVFKISDSFPNIQLNAAVVKVSDMDMDGDMDLLIGANAVPRRFGRSALNYLLYNDGAGHFEDVTDEFARDFGHIGLVEDIEVADFNGDGLPDVIAAGHWMPISLFINNGQGLQLESSLEPKKTHGLWNSVRVADFDRDGDLDIIAGNWGLNSRFKASEKDPMKLYLNDFDNNGKEEAILTYFEQGTETVFSSKEDLTKQMPSLNKKYLSFADFAKAGVRDLFDAKNLEASDKKVVYELGTCYFENKGNLKFHKHALPFLAQVSSVKTIYLGDFNKDGFTDALLAGNDHGISTQLGRLDASHGVLLTNDQRGFFKVDPSTLPDIQGNIRDINDIVIGDSNCLIMTVNDACPLILKLNTKKQ